jgi:hypothetical protein
MERKNRIDSRLNYGGDRLYSSPNNFQEQLFMNPIQTITTTVGIIAILIGLLLPAVQR